MSLSIFLYHALAVYFFQILMYLKAFLCLFIYKFDLRLFSFFSKPQRTDPETHLFLLLVRYQVVPHGTDICLILLDLYYQITILFKYINIKYKLPKLDEIIRLEPWINVHELLPCAKGFSRLLLSYAHLHPEQ